MTSAIDIVTRGYLPKELPPPFASTSLGALVQSHPRSKTNDSHCLRYSYSKYATVRRALSIPNPAHFISLAQSIAEHWELLTLHCNSSRLSRTKPVADSVRAISWQTPLDQMSQLRAEMRIGARYVLQADVLACYASMYTHAIPWALHSKPVAKANRRVRKSSKSTPTLPGNVLDEACRNIQSGQTIGIPIGPDTSLPIAEAILASVDCLVEDALHCASSAFRFVDDYEFSFNTLTEAEKARNVLQDALAEFELQLNPRKTRILELPAALDTPWVQDLAGFALGSSRQTALEAQLVRYFSRAFDLARSHPGDPILKYAVRRLSEVRADAAAVLLQRLLLQAAVSDPGVLQTALFVIHKHRERGLPVDLPGLTRALEALIVRHSALQHGGDVAWALWGAVVFGVKLGVTCVSAVQSLRDPIAVLMVLFAESKGTFTAALDHSQWEPLIDKEQLFQHSWMVAYEAYGHHWLTGKAGDPADGDAFFAEARKQKVCFIDANAALDVPPPSPVGEYS